jgi:hypothetical protein
MQRFIIDFKKNARRKMNETITPELIHILEFLFEIPLETDEDYRRLGEVFDEDE